jgi:hypothetical protein
MSTLASATVAPPRVQPAKLLHLHSAALAILLSLIGFHHFFFAGMSYPGRPITPPIRGLVITHGLTMSAWLVVALAQPLLVRLGYRDMHKKLGRFGAALALAVVAVGFWIAIASARVSPPEARIWGLSPKEFMAVPFFAAIAFASFIAVGLRFVRTPSIHRPMMSLATYAALSASVSRIDAISSLYAGTFFDWLLGPFFSTQVLCGLLVAIQFALTRTLDRWFAGGALAMTIFYMLVMRLATTDAWASLASLLVG